MMIGGSLNWENGIEENIFFSGIGLRFAVDQFPFEVKIAGLGRTCTKRLFENGVGLFVKIGCVYLQMRFFYWHRSYNLTNYFYYFKRCRNA